MAANNPRSDISNFQLTRCQSVAQVSFNINQPLNKSVGTVG